MSSESADFPIAFVLQLSFDDAEADQPHELAVTVLGPDLQPVGWRTMVPFTPAFGELHAEGWRGIFSIAGTLELGIEQFGPHSVQIDIDGKQAEDIPFRAVPADE